MRVLVVDDEAPARRRLVRMLRAARDAELVGEAASGQDAVTAIRRLTPDVVFLDVQMPGLDGFGVIREIGVDAMPTVVFVTAFDAHALRAFEVQALDYLLKPFSPERLETVLARIRTRLRLEQSKETAGPDVEDDPAAPGVETSPPLVAPPLQRLLVADGDREVLVSLARVDRIEAEGNYVRLFAGDRSYLLRQALTALEARLEPGRFLRANRSTLVRMDAIAEIQPWFHGDRRIVLRDGSAHMWSRRYRARERDRFSVY